MKTKFLCPVCELYRVRGLVRYAAVQGFHRCALNETGTAAPPSWREIYDGNWTRHVGVDGGRTLRWQGKVGLIGACTSVIDNHHTVMAAMGERFMMYRRPAVNEDELAARALEHQGCEPIMRRELTVQWATAVLAKTRPAERNCHCGVRHDSAATQAISKKVVHSARIFK